MIPLVVVRAIELKGANIVEVETEAAETFLISIPNKFNKMIWISKGTFYLSP